MAYYETGETQGMESLLHSFRMLVDRSQLLPPSQIEKYQNFIRLYRKLITTPPKAEGRISQLRDQINRLPPYYGKEWLLLKVDQLSGSD